MPPKRKAAKNQADAPQLNQEWSSAALRTFSREEIERALAGHMSKTSADIAKDIVNAWHKLEPAHIKYYEQRGIEILDGKVAIVEANERGFLLYFFEQLKVASDTDPHQQNSRDIHFFRNVYKQFQQTSKADRGRYVRRARAQMTKCSDSVVPHGLPVPELNSRIRNEDSTFSVRKISELDIITEQSELDAKTLEELEDRVRVGLINLAQLQDGLSKNILDETEHWLERVEEILIRGSSKAMKMAFVGATGSGKSSLINAILGTKILTEDSSRACTACPIEISYNKSSTEASEIRLTVEYVSEVSWKREVDAYLKMLRDGKPSPAESVLHDGDFEQMRDKMSILYPQLATDKLATMSSDEVMEFGGVTDRLGTETKHIYNDTDEVYRAIEELVWGSKSSDHQKNATPHVPLWPLIQFIRIEMKSEALENGITLVDLPGTQDLNKARAAVTEQQMKECSAVCIVMQTMRAADDALAGDLLKQAMRHQFFRDKISLILIGTKTDDIGAPLEVAHRVGARLQVDNLQCQHKEITNNIKDIQGKETSLEEKLRSAMEADRECQNAKDLYQTYKDAIMSGQFMSESLIPSHCRKRKRTVSQDINTRTSAGVPVGQCVNSNTISTVEELDTVMEIASVDKTLADAKKNINDFKADLSKLKSQRESAIEDRKMIMPQMYQACIQARNEITAEALKKTFAVALQNCNDIDITQQFNAAHHVNVTDEEVDECTQALKVIMVSAKAYHALHRKAVEDMIDDESASLKSFTDSKQTGIPDLREHCKSLAHAKRRAYAVAMLKDIAEVKIGMYLWVSFSTFGETVTSRVLSDARKDILEEFLGEVEVMHTRFKKMHNQIHLNVKKQIINHLTNAREEGKAAVVSALVKFGESITSSTTYRAIVKRRGVFTSSDGAHYNLNRVLLEPFNVIINDGWRQVFAGSAPATITAHRSFCHDTMKRIAANAIEKAEELGCSEKTRWLIQQQQIRHQQNVGNSIDALQQKIQFGSRAAREALEEAIQSEFADGYNTAIEVKGPGILAKIQTSLETSVKLKKDNMFSTGVKDLKKVLEDSLKQCVDEAGLKSRELLSAWERNLMDVFKLPADNIPVAEVKYRHQIAEILKKTYDEVVEEEKSAKEGDAQVTLKQEA